MDKRSWPWRKKSSEKITASNESFESTPFHSTRHLDDQDTVIILSDHTHMPDEGMIHWQEYEERLKELNDKLSAALLDAASKDVLVKQHAKVAEEAVSGWEKVEAEAATLKQQLDSAIQQRLATEDRVSHLDSALKECMRQLRHVREEQEQNIHDAIVKKTRDWDRVHSELEEKLANVEQSFLERDAENKVMSKSLQERARSIAEISEARSKAEAEVNMQRIRLESLEKESVAFKYEINVLHKELEIRKDEKGLINRAADAASKQHYEDIKKISKLEAECQRLRGLVRKKLPGPGALTHMRLEIEGPAKEKSDNNRRRSGKGAVSPRAALSVQLVQDITQEDDHQEKEGGLWLERFSALEEETKMLREVLTKRNNELQSARLMCARTASKLSTVEQQLDAWTHNQGIPQMPGLLGLNRHMETTRSLSNSVEPSLASVSEDGNDGEVSCAESWASALIVELDQFKKGKPIHISNKTVDTSKKELDDFMEMEHLASLSPSKSGKASSEKSRLWDHKDGADRKKMMGSTSITFEDNVSLEQSLIKKEAELQDASRLCEEVSAKLAAAEEELALWQSKNAANEANLLSLREKLNQVLEAQEESADIGKLLDEVRVVMGVPCHSIANLRSQIRRLSKVSHPSESLSRELTSQHTFPASADPFFEEEASSFAYDADFKLQGVRPELTLAVCKVVRLVEDLAAASRTEHLFQALSHRESKNSSVDPSTDYIGTFAKRPEDVQFKTLGLHTKCQKFTAVSNQFLHGKVDLIQLMTELSSVLSDLLKVTTEESNGSTPARRKSLSWGSSFHTSGEMEFSGVGSPTSDTSNSECSEVAAKIVPSDESSPHAVKKECFSADVSRVEEELRMVRSEKLALETHMRAEFTRFSGIEQELAQLKVVKVEMECTLAEDKEKLEHLRVQLHETKQLVANLQIQLVSVESSKQLGEEELFRMAASKEESDSQLKASRSELSKLHARIEAVGEEILNEQKKNSDLESKCREFQDQLLEKSNLSCPRCAMVDGEAAQVSKEQEIAAAAEKLAECQRTILVLGQQLKALASSKVSTDGGPPDQSVQRSLSLDQVPSKRYAPLKSHSATVVDDASEAGGNARFLQNEETFSDQRNGRNKKDLSWDPQDSISSDILDSELISLSVCGQASGRKMFDMFGDKVPVHEDYIEAVAQMPSSPEAEPLSPKRSASKPPHRKKRSPRSFARVDLSKSMNDAGSPSTEKHGSSFSRFFSRTKSSH